MMIEYKVRVHPDRTEWYNDQCQRHRLDGPAYESVNGDTFWYLNDKLHREDGPAIVYPDGSKFWWLNDKQYTEEEYVMIQFMNGVNIYA